MNHILIIYVHTWVIYDGHFLLSRNWTDLMQMYFARMYRWLHPPAVAKMPFGGQAIDSANVNVVVITMLLPNPWSNDDFDDLVMIGELIVGHNRLVMLWGVMTNIGAAFLRLLSHWSDRYPWTELGRWCSTSATGPQRLALSSYIPILVHQFFPAWQWLYQDILVAMCHHASIIIAVGSYSTLSLYWLQLSTSVTRLLSLTNIL